jgi:hypothetical protein
MKGNKMSFKVVEELRSLDPSVIINSLEDARELLIDDGLTLEESINLMDNYSDPVWVNNRESLLNTINSVKLEWDQNNQVLTRTFIFADEELYFDYRSMTGEVFSNAPRNMEIIAFEEV